MQTKLNWQHPDHAEYQVPDHTIKFWQEVRQMLGCSPTIILAAGRNWIGRAGGRHVLIDDTGVSCVGSLDSCKEMAELNAELEAECNDTTEDLH